MIKADAEKVRAQLSKWQERLLDLSRSNPLLGLNRSRVSKLRVTQPQAVELFKRFVMEEESVLRMPLVRKELPPSSQGELLDEQRLVPRFSVEPGDIEFEATPAELFHRLRRIYDNARTTVEERGVTTLYLTFGTLHWKDEFLGESVSPLWMVPCQLERRGPNSALRLSPSDEEMRLNPAIEYYLRERHKLSLPQLPEEPDERSLATFLENAKREVRELKWEVYDEVWISTFTFASLVIYEDLRAMAETAMENPIVATLARITKQPEGSEALVDDLDSQPTPEAVPVPVLPTDSSQLEALTYATMGRHLVIHGPPGTGKSQTIANLIADALGRNKKVLFVSAKMAALNVVYDRLKEKGLEQFCLEAHSTKAGKARIVDELRRTLDAAVPDGVRTRFDDELSALLLTRQELNGYVQDLHQRREPLGLTIYQALGKATKLHGVPDVRTELPWADPLAVTRDELNARLDALADIESHAAVYDSMTQHPWRGFVGLDASISQQEAIQAGLRLVRTAMIAILESLKPVSSLLVTPESLSIRELEVLADAFEATVAADGLPQNWLLFSSGQLEEIAKQFEMASELVSEAKEKSSEYESFLTAPLQEAKELLAPVRKEFSRWYRRLGPAYWRWRKSLVVRLRPGAKRHFAAFRHYNGLVSRLVEIENWLGEHEQQLLTEISREESRNYKELRRATAKFRAASLLRKALAAIDRIPNGGKAIGPEVLQSLTTLLTNLPSRNSQLLDAIRGIDALWPKGFVEKLGVADTPISNLLPRTEEVLSAMPRMREWILLQLTLDKCRDLGLSRFLDLLPPASARLARAVFERRFYTIWASAAMQRSRRLVEFSATRWHDLIRKFQILDERIMETRVKLIQAVASRETERVRTARNDVGAGGEVGILRYELQRRRRIKPLRKLFAEIPHVLQALKPCMLMSPISVSTFLKPGVLEFDLVVFDEASQLPTAESVPSILRGRQVIVAGDENQLPPTTFFEASLLTEEEPPEEEQNQAIEPLESLLDDCVAIVPMFQETNLRWHYRSRDERLIKFSNHYFYDNRLITFPSVSLLDEDRGVRLVYVPDGVWDRGRSRTNRMEARQVAKLVAEHFSRYPERSLGVVTMNTYQREAIEDAIEEELQHRPDLRPLLDSARQESFFVKSLESVQGDERDAIIISVAYGKDASGALTLNFGPLNMEGGWRRLNVLVTRAKWQILLVTSMRSHELRGVNPQNRGAIALRNFIEYVERSASLPQERPILTYAETNDFEDAVCEALKERGFTVDQQVGASQFRIDLAIRDRRDPTRYLLGIECDGATYHSSRTARDRDLLRQQVLQDMGWRLHRVWSTEWFHDRDRAIESILKSIEQAEATPADQLVEAPPPADANDDPETTVTEDTAVKREQRLRPIRKYSLSQPYRKYQLEGKRRNRKVLLSRRSVDRLSAQIIAIVDNEGPIHKDLLTERLKELYGVARAGSNIQSNINQAIRRATRTRKDLFGHTSKIQLSGDKKFLWPSAKKLRTFRTPVNGFKRSLELIPDEELQLAICYLVEDQFGMMRDQIPRAVAHLFGVDRLSGEDTDRLQSVVDGLVDRGVLRANGFQVYLG